MRIHKASIEVFGSVFLGSHSHPLTRSFITLVICYIKRRGSGFLQRTGSQSPKTKSVFAVRSIFGERNWFQWMELIMNGIPLHVKSRSNISCPFCTKFFVLLQADIIYPVYRHKNAQLSNMPNRGNDGQRKCGSSPAERNRSMKARRKALLRLCMNNDNFIEQFQFPNHLNYVSKKMCIFQTHALCLMR